MPRKKPEAEFAIEEKLLEQEDAGTSENTGSGKYKRKPSIRIPLTEEGALDMERIRKNPEILERARQALGMPEGVSETAAKVEFAIPEPMLKAVPLLFDGLALGIKFGMQKFKFPRAATDEQRAEFYSYLRYTESFKEKASEPTARAIVKTVGNSAFAKWLMQHSEFSELAALIAMGTWEMIQNAAQQFAIAQMTKQQTGEKPNGGFPPSEFRDIPVAPEQ